jgi:hypothetical protein
MSGLSRGLTAFLPVLLGLVSCGSGEEFTANVAGNYTVAITNGPNGCNWDMWKEGDPHEGVAFTITQDGKALTGKVMLGFGQGALAFALLFGTDDFTGSADGDSFTLSKPGNALTQGNCPYSYNATIDGTISGDSISGTITYATVTNGNPACKDVECSNTQKFSGSRPPQ